MDLLARVDWFQVLAALCFWLALVWAQHLDRGFPAWLRRLALPRLLGWSAVDVCTAGVGF